MRAFPESSGLRAHVLVARALVFGVPFAILSACASEPDTIDLLPLSSSSGGSGADAGKHTAQAGPCISDGDCSRSAPFCNVADGRCFQCMSSADCSGDRVCRAETHSCEPRCLSNADCVGIDRPVCSATGVCVECTTDGDCSGATPRCNPLNGVCVRCLVNTDCSPTRCIDDCYSCLNYLCVWRT
jgi:hypothetical protein